MSGSLFDFKKYVTPEAIEYYKMRDLLFGDNYQVQNVQKALELAAQCMHPEAVWLTAIFKEKAVSNRRDAKNVLVNYIYRSTTLPREAGKARYFIGGLTEDNVEANDENSLAISLGYTLAGVNKHWYPNPNHMQLYLEIAAQYGERKAFYCYGICLQTSLQRQRNKSNTEPMQCFEIAYALGCVKSALLLSNYYHQFDICRWRYLTFAALHNYARDYLEQLDLVIPQEEEDISNNAELGMFIGKTLKANYDEKTRLIFTWHASGAARKKTIIVIGYYTRQIESCRRAVDAWTLCAWRLGIYKDLRKMIGRLIWNNRDLGLY